MQHVQLIALLCHLDILFRHQKTRKKDFIKVKGIIRDAGTGKSDSAETALVVFVT